MTCSTTAFYYGIASDAVCPCGHNVLLHDFEDHPDDGTLICSVDGCDQVGCPGRATQVGGGE